MKLSMIDDILEPQWNDEDDGVDGFDQNCCPIVSAWDIISGAPLLHRSQCLTMVLTFWPLAILGPQYNFDNNDIYYATIPESSDKIAQTAGLIFQPDKLWTSCTYQYRVARLQ